MKLAVMQPYFLPYLGYWQLINAVDRFVIYDDVNFITRGWVNRNCILVNGKASYITVPLQKASQNKKISQMSLQASQYWRIKMLKSINNSYKKAPFYAEIIPVIEEVIQYDSTMLFSYLEFNIRRIAALLNIDSEIISSSRCYKNNCFSGQERILDICKYEKATTYVNPYSGEHLYSHEDFKRCDINLKFIKMRPMQYTQRVSGFIPNLSIVDALMEIGPAGVKKYLNMFDLS